MQKRCGTCCTEAGQFAIGRYYHTWRGHFHISGLSNSPGSADPSSSLLKVHTACEQQCSKTHGQEKARALKSMVCTNPCGKTPPISMGRCRVRARPCTHQIWVQFPIQFLPGSLNAVLQLLIALWFLLHVILSNWCGLKEGVPVRPIQSHNYRLSRGTNKYIPLLWNYLISYSKPNFLDPPRAMVYQGALLLCSGGL